MTADDFREIVLGMDGAVEGAHMKHPDFRANGRIFATLAPGEASGVLMVSPEEQQELMRLHPKVFAPAAGAWGRQGCTTVSLAAAKKPEVKAAVLLAYQRVIAQPPPRARSRTTPRRPRRI